MNKGILIAIIIVVLLLVMGVVGYMMMEPTYVLPVGLVNGVVYGVDGQGIWKIENDTRRWYSAAAYSAAGSPTWTKYTDVALFLSVPIGEPM